MLEFLVGGTVLLMLSFFVVQLAFLLSGQSAIETAAHLAARRFAVNARVDLRKAKAVALADASSACRLRMGAGRASTSLTRLDVLHENGSSASGSASPGEAYQVCVSHWIELGVPWIDRILYKAAPVSKAQLGERYFFILSASRWVTVE